jgi:hypothetical protein
MSTAGVARGLFAANLLATVGHIIRNPVPSDGAGLSHKLHLLFIGYLARSVNQCF